MERSEISIKLELCFQFELDDLINRFDAIMESLMEIDVQRNQVRDAINEWCISVDTEIQNQEAVTADSFLEDMGFALAADEVFGTEV
jgi:hypothetical protein